MTGRFPAKVTPARPGSSGAELDAVVLAGGRASRLGGQDKPALVVGQRSLVESVVLAARAAGASRVVVVGPSRAALGPGVLVVREQPPGGGPVAALRRGLAEVRAPWVAVLAADLPFLTGEHLAALLAAGAAQPGAGEAGAGNAGAGEAGAAQPGAWVAGAGQAGAVLTDESGQPQWLAGCWRTVTLQRAISGYDGSSMRGLLTPLRPVLLALARPGGEPPPWLDCDTPDDLRRARAWFEHDKEMPGE